ncbi:DUF1772 domain-containing protein [Chelativorans sp. AA-79]|uniref:DUF1772 domain-containing protein n=1 Tax=Chelativorans sp. AA-79 TaxID=3028735 RepID=UPI0023F74C48|nr:DUF1772 domain-containing protein [Chelativorans sp. AA-79]WEX11700.1 DUF1772 domain-containing protein [Chelativorans sp. AA-79]
MLPALQVLAIIFAAAAMALSLAHALELPGKMRLSKEEYLAVQPIYYPGFTIGGLAEPIGILLTGMLLFFLPAGSVVFWLTAAALLALAAMHAAYWLLTHPVNNFWLKDFELDGSAARFFAVGAGGGKGSGNAARWTDLRDRWEFSHVVRAALGLAGLALLATSAAL